MAENVARNLSNHYGSLSTSTQRLSSGLRINSSADDAAGLAVRELMRSDIATMNQGVRNCNDAVSMIQTADGALQVIDEKLIRMKELAEQAATGTYTSDQRMIIDSEFKAMSSEINRIAEATNFNGIKMINSINPDVDPMSVQNWTNLNSSGFGSASNASTEALQEYNGKLYAGTSNSSGGQVWAYDGSSWSQVNADGFGNTNNTAVFDMKVYNGSLYATTNNTATGGEVWKYDGTSWIQVNADGFGDSNNTDIQSMQTYNDKLYASTGNSATGTQIWEYDGNSWANVASNGFGNSNNFETLSMSTYRGELYAGTCNNSTGSEVWKYDGSSWTKSSVNGLGDSDNVQIQSLVSYNDKLYAGTANFTSGGSVYSYDGTSWQKISLAGFGNSNNSYIENIIQYNNRIYATTANSVDGAGVWAYDGDKWSQVNDGGFGSKSNIYSDGMAIYNGQLVAGTFNSTDGTGIYALDKIQNSSIKIHFGTSNSSAEDYYYIYRSNMTTGVDGLNIQYLNIGTQYGAQYSLNELSKAMVKTNTVRANLGATQNRLENTISNLGIQAENLQAAESQISDTDVASEMTNFVREQILTQAAVAMLSQANSMPKMALQLIQGS
jgi:flagellin